MEPFISAIIRTHLVLVAISTALLVYALSPHDAQRFYADQIEAEAIERYAQHSDDFRPSRPFSSSVIADSEQRFHDIAESFRRVGVAKTVQYDAPLSELPPGPNSRLSDIASFFDTPPVLYPVAPSNNVLRQAFDHAFGTTNDPPMCWRREEPTILERCDPIQEGAQFDYATVRDLRGNLHSPDTPRWVLILRFFAEARVYEQQDDQSWYGQFYWRYYAMPLDGIDTQHKEPSWVSNTIKKILKANPQLSTVRQNPIKRTVLTLVAKVFSDNRSEESTPNGLQIDMPLSRGNFADAFPNLTEAWGEIAAMTATEAVKYFRDKAGAARQNLNVIGQPLDERILSFAGPVAVLFVAAYLLCNLLVMRRALVTYEAPTANALLFTWIGLHEKGIPSLVTTASILYLPVMSSISLYIQSAGALDVGKAVGLGATTLTAVCANQALKVTTLLHADLERARSVARGKAGSDRRAAKGNKD